MNGKDDLCVEQARAVDAEDTRPDSSGSAPDSERIRLVQECIYIVEQYGGLDGTYVAAMALRNHFGIPEPSAVCAPTADPTEPLGPETPSPAAPPEPSGPESATEHTQACSTLEKETPTL